MKRLLVIGAGTAGTMVVNRLRRTLDTDEWKITIVDPVETHYYQPGFLFIPFGMYSKNDVVKPRRDFIPAGVDIVKARADVIEPDKNRVKLDRRDHTQLRRARHRHGHRYPPRGDPGPRRARVAPVDVRLLQPRRRARARETSADVAGRTAGSECRGESHKVPRRASRVHHAGRLVLSRARDPRPGGTHLRDPSTGCLHQAHRLQVSGRHPGGQGHQGRARVPGRARRPRCEEDWCTTTRPSSSTTCW